MNSLNSLSNLSIAIVGGGTAGWLAANHLGRVLGADPAVRIALIESPDIPIIGVGEGTVPTIRQSLRDFGISESDFIRRCDVSFKQAIKYVNWMDRARHGTGNSYYHLFDYPFPGGEDIAPLWNASAREKSYAHQASVQAAVCDAGRAPKSITTPEYEGDTTYAYHFDAKKFAALLKDNATTRFGVEYIPATVTDAVLDPSGNIEALETREAGRLAFDFYVDATGLASFLLGEKLGVEFVSKRDQLLVDAALVAQVPDDSGEIPPYTLATAHQAGWIWDIALPERRGVGFVYSSRHMAEVQAREKFRRYLGDKAAGLAFRKIPINVGRRAHFWEKNCVALGLAQGFVEPLEATSILLTDFSARLLAERLPRAAAGYAAVAREYNRTVVYSWERVFEFVKMHYCLSDRSDSTFWSDNRKPETIPQGLAERLALWQVKSPSVLDFFSKFEIFDVENFLYVLYGMKYETQPEFIPEDERQRLENLVRSVEQASSQLAARLPGHRDLLERIKKYGLQKL